jgi:hypothetical protein
MITIPTTELIGGLTDVLPVITDPKSDLAGVVVEWDGALHFTAYDVYSGATVLWIPGEGAEGDDESQEYDQDETDFGGDDAPWRTWIWLDSAKEILKLFKLPAKLWRTPVTLKCTPVGDLLIERIDSPRGNRELRVPGDPDKARSQIPHVGEIFAKAHDTALPPREPVIAFFHQRLGAFGAARAHGTMTLWFGAEGEPTGVRIGTRYRGFIYPSDATNVRPFNLLRDGAGVVTHV